MALIGVREVPGTQANGGFEAGSKVVASALDDLVGEQLFPVFQGDGVADPSVVALDASGATITVDLTEKLDQVGLLRALNHAGAVSQMSRGELAARYPGGLEGFQRKLASYLDSVPYRRPKTGGDGSRLVVICSEAKPEIWNAVEFLNRADLPVTILRANSLHAIDGEVFVDLSPLTIPRDGQPQLATVSPGATASGTGRPVTPIVPPDVGKPKQRKHHLAPAFTRAERRRRQAEAQATPAEYQPGQLEGSDQVVPASKRPIRNPELQTAIERAEAALKAADSFLARANNQPEARPSRKQLRAIGELGQHQVEFTGVFAQGTAPHDHLSWDTTTLPVIAKPRQNPLA